MSQISHFILYTIILVRVQKAHYTEITSRSRTTKDMRCCQKGFRFLLAYTSESSLCISKNANMVGRFCFPHKPEPLLRTQELRPKDGVFLFARFRSRTSSWISHKNPWVEFRNVNPCMGVFYPG